MENETHIKFATENKEYTIDGWKAKTIIYSVVFIVAFLVISGVLRVLGI